MPNRAESCGIVRRVPRAGPAAGLEALAGRQLEPESATPTSPALDHIAEGFVLACKIPGQHLADVLRDSPEVVQVGFHDQVAFGVEQRLEKLESAWMLNLERAAIDADLSSLLVVDDTVTEPLGHTRLIRRSTAREGL